MAELERIVPSASRVGEGPLWHPGEQTLYWIDIRGLKVWRYRPAELPHIAQWMLVRAGTYVTALEPHNFSVWSRAEAREAGTLLFLAPGERREYNFEVGVLANNQEIETAASQVIVS